MSNMMIKWVGRYLVCTLAFPVSVALIGCGAEDQALADEWSAEDGTPAEAQDLSASSDEADSPSDASEEEGEETILESSDELVEKRRNCSTVCTVEGHPDLACPATIGGFGRTTFLGGCKKACGFARDDAAAKIAQAFPGCVTSVCTDSCN